MLRVPELRPDQESFDPQRTYSMHPGIQQADHVLRVGGVAADSGALLSGSAAVPAWNQEATAEERGELDAARERDAVFDDTAVRDALTELHELGDDFELRLAELPGSRANEINAMAEEFLREQGEKLSAQLTNDRQKRLFENGFDVFAAQTLERSGLVRANKTDAWREEVTARQNGVFLERALRQENLFDDDAQTALRDMYLFNVDNLNVELSGSERNFRLDAAGRDFYTRVLEKRLELDPARMLSMLDAPAVRRVVGDDLAESFEARAGAAIRADEIRALGEEWAGAGLDPEEMEKRAGEAFSDCGEHATALEHYWSLREAEGREMVAHSLMQMGEAWNDVREGEEKGGGRNTALRRVDPELAGHMERAVHERRKNGGIPLNADYALLVHMTDDFDSRQATENFRDRQRLLEVHDKLGGFETPEFSLYMRMYLGQATPADSDRLEGLRLARNVALKERGKEVSDTVLSQYLHRYSENCRIFMKRNAFEELDWSEKNALARKTLGEMEWN